MSTATADFAKRLDQTAEDTAPALAPDPTPGEDDSPPPAVASSAAVGIDEVILAWADILPGLPVATRSAVQD